ncbi:MULTISPECIES: hypothetical protein [unclassified Leifsonia]|uniref:hypothetical protein n=1 Tax=unclassified Leifsonia TaxID=2663824 RepID=UPI000B7C72BF|nr:MULTISPECIES: hypothetical protein [unclassified Leifsonia]
MSLIYPYLVTDAYPGTSDASLSRGIGHGVFVQIVEDHDGVVASAGPERLASGGGGIEVCLPEAIANLDALLRSGAIGSRVFPTGPGGMPFALFGGHWAASSVLILPSLLSILGPHLGTKLVASVPHREALLVFPASDASSRDEVRDFVREHESDGARPLTPELFALTAGWPHPID